MTAPLELTILMPCLNEAEHLQGLAEALLPAARRLNGAILIADGGSTDGTREIAAGQFAAIARSAQRHRTGHVARRGRRP